MIETLTKFKELFVIVCSNKNCVKVNAVPMWRGMGWI